MIQVVCVCTTCKITFTADIDRDSEVYLHARCWSCGEPLEYVE